MKEIARRAGLGVATLYRHFPSRHELLDAVFAEHVAACSADMHAALSDPDPWRALAATVHRFADHHVRDRHLNDALLGSRTAALAFADQCLATTVGLETLVELTRDTGAVRPDALIADLHIGLRAIASLPVLPPEQADATINGLANLVLAGMSGHGLAVDGGA